MSKLIVGLDMGTTSISAVALDETGRVVESVTKTHHAAVQGLKAEYAEQDPDKILQSALAALKDLSGRCGNHGDEIVGLALTGQMHSTVMLDGSRCVIGHVITWQDRRSLTILSEETLLSQLQQRATDPTMLPTGCRLALGYLGTTLFALRRLGQLSDRIAGVCFVADWIGSCLTEQPPMTERSHAASSGLYDLVTDCWSSNILNAAEIPAAWLPRVADSGAVTGKLTPAMAAGCGLPAGLPVLNAIGDNRVSVLSALPNLDGAILINIGTGGQIVWRVPAFVRELPLDTRVLPGDPNQAAGRTATQFMIVGAGLCGGDAIAWVNRTVRQWLRDFGLSVSEDEVWDKLSGQVRLLQDSGELVCEPFFRGTRYEPDRRGVLRGINTENLTPAHLLASVLDGIAQSMYDVWRSSVQSSKMPLRQVAMSGNAVKHNPLLVEAVRRRFGVPVMVARHKEEAATGTAMLAGVHLGIWNTIEDARRAVQQAAESATE